MSLHFKKPYCLTWAICLNWEPLNSELTHSQKKCRGPILFQRSRGWSGTLVLTTIVWQPEMSGPSLLVPQHLSLPPAHKPSCSCPTPWHTTHHCPKAPEPAKHLCLSMYSNYLPPWECLPLPFSTGECPPHPWRPYFRATSMVTPPHLQFLSLVWANIVLWLHLSSYITSFIHSYVDSPPPSRKPPLAPSRV